MAFIWPKNAVNIALLIQTVLAYKNRNKKLKEQIMSHRNDQRNLTNELEEQMDHLEIKLGLARIEDRLEAIEDKINHLIDVELDIEIEAEYECDDICLCDLE